MAEIPIDLSFDALGQIKVPNASELLTLVPPGMMNEFQSLSGTITTDIQKGIGLLQKAKPATDLVQKVIEGGKIDPMMVVGAVAATAALVNPIAGAIIGAGGALAVGLVNASEGLFRSLGLIPNTPPTYFYTGLIRRGDPLPYGHDSDSWKSYDYWTQKVKYDDPKFPRPNADPVPRWRNVTFLMNEESKTHLGTQTILRLLDLMRKYGTQYGKVYPPPNVQTPQPATKPGMTGFEGPLPQNKFEEFFFHMLKQDIENWMNANPSVLPKDLLMGAVSLWNHVHPASSKDVVYSGNKTRIKGINDNPIDFIISAAGDPTGNFRESPPLTIHMGETAGVNTASGYVPPPITDAQKQYWLNSAMQANAKALLAKMPTPVTPKIVPKAAVKLSPLAQKLAPKPPVKPAVTPFITAGGGATIGFFTGGPIGAAIGGAIGFGIGKLIK
jgi:hypothetical protein